MSDTGIELNPFYCDIARRRAGQFADLLAYTLALREGASTTTR